jgi:hypothetical protein
MINGYGFQLISDMSRDQMIDEIIDNQRAIFATVDDDTLKRHLVEFRVTAVKKRLIAEAGLEVRGILGWLDRNGESDDH